MNTTALHTGIFEKLEMPLYEYGVRSSINNIGRRGFLAPIIRARMSFLQWINTTVLNLSDNALARQPSNPELTDKHVVGAYVLERDIV